MKNQIVITLSLSLLLAISLPVYAVNELSDSFNGASSEPPDSPWSISSGSPAYNGAGQLVFDSNDHIYRTIADGNFTMELSWTDLWLGDGTLNYDNCAYELYDPNGNGSGQRFNVRIQEQPDSSNIYFFCRAWIDGEAYKPEYDFAVNLGALLDAGGSTFDLKVVYHEPTFTFTVYYSVDGGPLLKLLVRDCPPAWVASSADRIEYIGLGSSIGDAAGKLDSYSMTASAEPPPTSSVIELCDPFDGANGTAPNSPWVVNRGNPMHNGLGQLEFLSSNGDIISRTIGKGDFTVDLSWTDVWLGDDIQSYENLAYGLYDAGQNLYMKIQEQPNSDNIYVFCRAWIDGEAYKPEYEFAANMGALLVDPNSTYDLKIVYDDTEFTFTVYWSINGEPMTKLLERDCPPAWVASTASRSESIALREWGDAVANLDSYCMVGDKVHPAKVVVEDIVKAPYATISVDGDPSDWDGLNCTTISQDSSCVGYTHTFDPNDPDYPPTFHAELAHDIRFAWDDDYLYILVEQTAADYRAEEPNSFDAYNAAVWNFDAVSFNCDLDNSNDSSQFGDCMLNYAYSSTGRSDLYSYNRNGNGFGTQEPELIPNGSVATSGTQAASNRVIEAAIRWSDLASSVDTSHQPDGDLLAAIGEGFIFGCEPLIWDFGWHGSTYRNCFPDVGGHYNPPSGGDEFSTDILLITCPVTDFDDDCDVDLSDFAKLANSWLADGCEDTGSDCHTLDVVPLGYGDGVIDAKEIEELAMEWLYGK